ncbi:MAG: PEP-CTERM sorting domain-containing protein [Proteobacteria bacterium]|nr:PEP-CTERM sorting domain-containing protein [Pseudomonadota bacterium]
MTACFAKPRLRNLSVFPGTQPIIFRASRLAQAIRLGLALVATNSVFPAQAVINCPVQSPQTITGAETLNSACDLQGGGSINVQGGGSITITNTGAMTGAGTLNNSGALYIGSQGRLISYSGGINNAGSLVNDGGLGTYKGTISNTGTLTNNYALANSYGSLTNHTGATLTNNGLLYNDKNAGMVNQAGAILTNNGVLTNYSSSLSNAGGLTNQAGGYLTNDGSSSLTNTGSLNNQAGATLTNQGNVDNQALGSLVNSGTFNIESTGGVYNRSAANLENSGTLNNAGYVDNVGTVTNQAGGTLTNTGAFFNELGGMLANKVGATVNNHYGIYNYSGATFTNAGTINNVSRGDIINFFGATFTNTGILNTGTLNNQTYSGTVYTEGMLTNEGTLNNVATVEIDTPGSIEGTGTFIQTSGVTKVNGLLQQPVIDIQGGELLGEGTILGSIILGSAAKLNPGFGFGKLTVDGGIVFNGSLLVDIAGIAADKYDLLDAYGGAVNFGVGSLIAINLDSLFAPEGGMAWDFLLSDNPFLGSDNAKYQVNGLNSSMDYMIREVERDGRHALEFTVPEPGSLALFGLGGLLMVRRRSSQAI